MKQYLALLVDILDVGQDRRDRTGVGTRSVFGRQLRFDLRKGFPLLTTKKVWFKAIKAELLWFLRGETNIKSLNDDGVHIWDEWAEANGNLGPVYGEQWRLAGPGSDIDQLQNAIDLIKRDPFSRRIIVDSWQVAALPYMNLSPCHMFFQFYVDVDNGELDLQMYQRSADVFLGVPFNIASYALLLSMVAKVTKYKPRYFIHTFGDVHIYQNHLDQVNEQLGRAPRPLPKLELNGPSYVIDGWELNHITLRGYDPHPSIKASIAV